MISRARFEVSRRAIIEAPARKVDRWDRYVRARCDRGHLRGALAYENLANGSRVVAFDRGSWSPRRFARFLGLFARAWGVGS